MKNMTNKEIYFYLQDICENNYNKYTLEEDYYVHKFKPFKDDIDGETVYGYYQEEFFNLKVLKKNLVWPYFWVKILYYLTLWVILFIGISFGYTSPEFITLGLFWKFFFILIGVIFAGNLIREFPSFLRNFGACTTQHFYKSDGNKKEKILGTYSDTGNIYNFNRF